MWNQWNRKYSFHLFLCAIYFLLFTSGLLMCILCTVPFYSMVFLYECTILWILTNIYSHRTSGTDIEHFHCHKSFLMPLFYFLIHTFYDSFISIWVFYFCIKKSLGCQSLFIPLEFLVLSRFYFKAGFNPITLK